MIGPSAESWGTGAQGLDGPNLAIAKATAGARDLWNNARDMGATSGRTTSVYEITSPPNPTYETTDILVMKWPITRAGAGGMDTANGPPYKLYVREDMA